MVEERFTNNANGDGDDSSGGMWYGFQGCHHLGPSLAGPIWRLGTSTVRAFIRRDGTTLRWDREQNWVNWQCTWQEGWEQRFCTDIFVGFRQALYRRMPPDKNDCRGPVRGYPTPLKGCDEIFKEAGRLWLAGHVIGEVM